MSSLNAPSAWLCGLPKVSLHCHLEGTLQPPTFRRLAARYGIELGERATRSDREFYQFSTFIEFLMNFRSACAVLKAPADYGVLAAEHLATAIRDGVVAAELFVSPNAWLRLHPDLDVRAAFEAIAVAIRRSPLHVELIVDLTRNFGPDQAMQGVAIAQSMQDLGVIGVGLGGDEMNFPAELFEKAFRVARKAGLHCVAHAGEADGAASVRAAVEVLCAERIGHGVRAIDDPGVLALLVERNIALEQSPASNRLTGVVSGEHPMRRFVEAGVRVAVDADDPALFGSSILNEFQDLEGRYGRDFVFARAQDAVAVSFLDETNKSKFAALLEEFRPSPAAPGECDPRREYPQE